MPPDDPSATGLFTFQSWPLFCRSMSIATNSLRRVSVFADLFRIDARVHITATNISAATSNSATPYRPIFFAVRPEALSPSLTLAPVSFLSVDLLPLCKLYGLPPGGRGGFGDGDGDDGDGGVGGGGGCTGSSTPGSFVAWPCCGGGGGGGVCGTAGIGIKTKLPNSRGL
jgi:hypothetical protein